MMAIKIPGILAMVTMGYVWLCMFIAKRVPHKVKRRVTNKVALLHTFYVYGIATFLVFIVAWDMGIHFSEGIVGMEYSNTVQAWVCYFGLLPAICFLGFMVATDKPFKRYTEPIPDDDSKGVVTDE